MVYFSGGVFYDEEEREEREEMGGAKKKTAKKVAKKVTKEYVRVKGCNRDSLVKMVDGKKCITMNKELVPLSSMKGKYNLVKA